MKTRCTTSRPLVLGRPCKIFEKLYVNTFLVPPSRSYIENDGRSNLINNVKESGGQDSSCFTRYEASCSFMNFSILVAFRA